MGIFCRERNRFYVIKVGSLDRRIFSYFPKGLTMTVVKKWLFFYFLFVSKNDLKKMFRDLVDREEWFLAYKNMLFSYLHFCIFSKGVNLWYWSKNGFFFLFSSWAIIILKFFGGGNLFDRKQSFLNFFVLPFWPKKPRKLVYERSMSKKKPFQKSKNINLTRSKICTSSYFRLRQNERRKRVYELSISKKPFLD